MKTCGTRTKWARMLMGCAVAGGLILVTLPMVASARQAANDLSPNLGYTALVSAATGRATESLDFAIAAYVTWDGGEPATLELTVTLPPGIRWAGKPPGAADGCTSAPQRVSCTKAVTPTAGTNLAAAFGEWRVVAERSGAYTFEATVVSKTQTDPSPSNDTTTMTVNVGNKPGGVSLRPRSAAAGSTVVASHPIYVQSVDRTFPAARAAVACMARIGSKRVTARGTFTGTRVTCTVKTPANAHGKRLTGTLRTTSGPGMLTKRFSVTLR